MKRLTILCTIALLALGMMGFGFAKWSDNVTVSAATHTGKVVWGFVSGSAYHHDLGPDPNCDNGMLNVWQLGDPLADIGTQFFNPEGKDVASTDLDLIDTNSDGVKDKLDVTINNAYPGYYNEISVKVNNFGTIPVKVGKAVITWMGHEYIIDTGKVYSFNSDGTVTEYFGDTPVNELLEFCWLDNEGAQQHPGVVFEESFEIHVLQPSAQNAQYKFGLSLEATQWNEVH